jgi:TrmH family RNA methyltransferase
MSGRSHPLSNSRIVLVRTSHPGNIGSAARAMKNMGIASLVLVAPKRFPDPEATALASGADDVLAGARVVESLTEAIGDCVAAYALSARMREWGPENVAVRDAAIAAVAGSGDGPIAFVFGNEASGLTNEELLACQHHVRIPTDPAWSSINLAQAVQIVAYELRMAATVAAEKVRRTGAPYEFTPMSSRERRIVHLALREDTDLRTESEGEGMGRRLVVYPKDYKAAPRA